MPHPLSADHTHDVYNDIYYTTFCHNENNDDIYKISHPLILLSKVIAIPHYMSITEPDNIDMVLYTKANTTPDSKIHSSLFL